jgi:hypothetical protein
MGRRRVGVRDRLKRFFRGLPRGCRDFPVGFLGIVGIFLGILWRAVLAIGANPKRAVES